VSLDKKAIRQYLEDAAGYAKDARNLLRYKNVDAKEVVRKIDAARDMLDRAREEIECGRPESH